MSKSNSTRELVHEILGAYQQGDEEKLRSLMHPESETYTQPGLINAGTYRGFDGFQDWIRHWEEAWDGASYELGEMTEIGDSRIVVPVRIVARGAGSGVEIDSTFGWMYEFREGQATRFHVYATVEEAIEAARALRDG